MAKFQDVAKVFADKQARTVYCVYYTGEYNVKFITVEFTRKEAFDAKEVYRASIGCTEPHRYHILPEEVGLDYAL